MATITTTWKRESLPIVIKQPSAETLETAWSASSELALRWRPLPDTDVTAHYADGSIEVLGYGAFGLVFHGSTRDRPQRAVAVKMVFVRKNADEVRKQALAEVRSLLYRHAPSSCR